MTPRIFAFLFLVFIAFGNSTNAAPPNAPVIRVDGQVVTASPTTRGEQASISMTTTFANGAMFYTLDGSVPTAASTRYNAAFTITSTKTIRAIAYSVDFAQSAEADPLEVRIVPFVNLTVNALGGAVALNPAGGRYLQGAVVRLTASGQAGWTFMNWSGAASGSANPIDVTMDTAKTVNAIFGSPLNVIDPANGEIVTSPPVQAAALYAVNSSFKVMAAPDPGFYLVSWGGALSGAAPNTTYVHSTPNASISALFSPVPEGKATLTATSSAGGAAEVFDYREKGGPTNLYSLGTTMFVIGRPSAGYAFTGWSGDASGTENPITLKLDASKRVHANFAAGASLTIHSTDGGTVTRSVDGPAYAVGTVVELTATPAAGHTFVGWFGAATGTANPTTVTVNSDITVTARFAAAAWEPLWSHAGNGQIAAKGDILYTGGITSLTSDGDERWAQDLRNVQGYRVTVGPLVIDPVGNLRILYYTLDEFDFEAHSLKIITRDPAGNSVAPAIDFGRRTLHDFAIANTGDIHTVVPVPGRHGIVGRELRAHTASGQAKWTFAVEAWRGGLFGDVGYDYFSRPAIDLNNNLYFGGHYFTNSIYSLTAAGAQRWRLPVEFGNIGSAFEPGVRDYNGAVYKIPPGIVLGESAGYTIEGDGTLLAFDLNGNVLWRFAPGDLLLTPSIGADGALYLGARNSNRFYAVNPNGTLRWVSRPSVGNYTTAAIGEDGTIYITAERSLIAMNASGVKVKEYIANNALRAPIIENGRLYTSTSTEVFAFGVPGGAANSPWPMVRANAQGTSAVRAVVATPTISGVSMTQSGFQFVVNARPGATVKVYRSADGVDWTLHHTETTASGQVTVNYAAGPDVQMFVVSAQ